MNQPELHGCFVTGTDTDVGKTLVSAALLHWCARQGWRSVGYKPVSAGTDLVQGEWVNADVQALRQASSVALTHAEVGPVQLRAACAPHIAAALEEQSIALPPLVSQARMLAARADVLVVEGAGGFCVPLGPEEDTADLAQALGLPVVLVVGLRLGCLNHALLTAQAIGARKLVLAGWVGNVASSGMPYLEENIATLGHELQRRHQAPCLGVVPHLAQPSAAQAAAHLDATELQFLFSGVESKPRP